MTRPTPPTNPPIPHRWLLPLRGLWIVAALICLWVFVAHLPLLQRTIASFAYENDPSPAAVRVGLAQLGIPEAAYVALRFGAQVTVVLGFLLTSALIFWRRSDDRGALLVSLQLLLFGTLFAVPIDYAPPTIWLSFAAELVFTSFFYACYWFPNGRFVPRWTRWLILVWIASVVGGVFFPGSWLDSDTWAPVWSLPFLLLLAGSCIGAQVYRYRRVAGPLERQQIKWVVWGFAVLIACFIGYNQVFAQLPALSAPGRSAALYDLIPGTVQLLSFLLVPLSIGYAMLRHRLYDVDIVINRTLVYGSLSLLLALLYVGLVVVLQSIVRWLTGTTESDLVTVVSTLIIATLFGPLRRRVQALIDRRFYRQKYDAQKTLRAFSARLRDETDLTHLRADLEGVAREALQPAHISLWLRDHGSGRRKTPL
jgi:hypothetical protein